MICPMMSRPRHSADPRPQTGTFIDCQESLCALWANGDCGLKISEAMTGTEDCPKCSSPFVALQYRAESDDLAYTCRHCGYGWVGPCTPPVPFDEAAP